MMAKRRYAAIAVIAALAMVMSGCSKKSSASGGTDWSTATSVASGGGMDALIAAAKAEGTLNAIALPSDWANYGTIIDTFKQKYGIDVKVANPSGSSQDEIDAVNQQSGTAAAPDVLDVGMAVAYPNTSFAPYQVAT
jgi:putative spermidine/putrescine transport system substrate-binding protein